MNFIYESFHHHLDVVHFVYGLTYILIAISILSKPKKNSSFKLAKILWFFVAYALLHAPADFIKMWTIIKGENEFALLIGKILTLTSYIFVFEFGRRILRILKPDLFLLDPIILLVLVPSLIIISTASDNFLTTFDVLMGYFVRFPGGIMAAIGLRYYYINEKNKLPVNVKKYFFMSGAALFAWAFFCGLVRVNAGFFPSNIINLDSFFAYVKIPVYVFRSFCALIVAWSFTGILSIFNWETQKKIGRLLDTEKEMKEYFYKIINNMTDSLFVTDNNGIITDLNHGTLDLLNYKRDELTGKHISILFSGDQFLFETIYEELLLGNSPISYELEFFTKYGEKIPVIFSYSKFFKKSDINNNFHVVGVAKNITGRKIAEKKLKHAKDVLELRVKERTAELENSCIDLKKEIELREIAEKEVNDTYKFQQMILDNLIDSVIVIDSNKNIRLKNKAAQQIYDKDQLELYSTNIPGYKNLKETITIENKISKDDNEKHIEVQISPLISENGDLNGFVETVRDITKRRQLEKEIINISEIERQRIGQDIHDDLAQNLVAVDVLCQMIHKKMKVIPENDDIIKNLTQVIKFVDYTVTQCRRIAKGLCPVTLGPESLIHSIKQMMNDIENVFNISFKFTSEGIIKMHDDMSAINLYHIVQEAINNIIKHSKAKNVLVNLKSKDSIISLTIQDDGIGISKDFNYNEGLGLKIMKYRANIIGGTLNVESNDDGTTISFILKNTNNNITTNYEKELVTE